MSSSEAANPNEERCGYRDHRESPMHRQKLKCIGSVSALWLQSGIGWRFPGVLLMLCNLYDIPSGIML